MTLSTNFATMDFSFGEFLEEEDNELYKKWMEIINRGGFKEKKIDKLFSRISFIYRNFSKKIGEIEKKEQKELEKITGDVKNQQDIIFLEALCMRYAEYKRSKRYFISKKIEDADEMKNRNPSSLMVNEQKTEPHKLTESILEYPKIEDIPINNVRDKGAKHKADNHVESKEKKGCEMISSSVKKEEELLGNIHIYPNIEDFMKPIPEGKINESEVISNSVKKEEEPQDNSIVSLPEKESVKPITEGKTNESEVISSSAKKEDESQETNDVSQADLENENSNTKKNSSRSDKKRLSSRSKINSNSVKKEEEPQDNSIVSLPEEESVKPVTGGKTNESEVISSSVKKEDESQETNDVSQADLENENSNTKKNSTRSDKKRLSSRSKINSNSVKKEEEPQDNSIVSLPEKESVKPVTEGKTNESEVISSSAKKEDEPQACQNVSVANEKIVKPLMNDRKEETKIGSKDESLKSNDIPSQLDEPVILQENEKRIEYETKCDDIKETDNNKHDKSLTFIKTPNDTNFPKTEKDNDKLKLLNSLKRKFEQPSFGSSSHAQRIEQEKREAQRIEQEKREAQRIEQEKREAQRIEQEKREAQRIEQEKREAQRIEQEKREAQRIEQEKREAQRIEQEKRDREAKAKPETKVGKISRELFSRSFPFGQKSPENIPSAPPHDSVKKLETQSTVICCDTSNEIKRPVNKNTSRRPPTIKRNAN